MKFNLDTRELSLYLAVTVARDKLEELGLGDLVMVCKKERGRHPGVTTEEILRRHGDTATPSHCSMIQSDSQQRTRQDKCLG